MIELKFDQNSEDHGVAMARLVAADLQGVECFSHRDVERELQALERMIAGIRRSMKRRFASAKAKAAS